MQNIYQKIKLTFLLDVALFFSPNINVGSSSSSSLEKSPSSSELPSNRLAGLASLPNLLLVVIFRFRACSCCSIISAASSYKRQIGIINFSIWSKGLYNDNFRENINLPSSPYLYPVWFFYHHCFHLNCLWSFWTLEYDFFSHCLFSSLTVL